jgi:hypothetical protein
VLFLLDLLVRRVRLFDGKRTAASTSNAKDAKRVPVRV